MSMLLRLVTAVILGLALLLAPAIARADAPRTVVVGTHVNHIYGIDIKSSQYSVDFYIWFRWEGDDLKPLDSFEVASGRVVSKTGIQRKKLGTQNYVSARVVATMTEHWDLKRYPLDGHTLELEIEDAELDTRTIVYQRDVANVGINPDLQIPGFIVRGFRADVEQHIYRTNYGDTSLPTHAESTYSRYRFSVDIVRPGYGRFLKVFFGLFIAVLVSWCAFWVRPRESSPRVSLGVGATFAASAFTVTIHNSLPDAISVTMADKLIMLTLGIIVLSVIQTIVALSLFAMDRDAARLRLDRTCQWLFPAAYLVALVFVVR